MKMKINLALIALFISLVSISCNTSKKATQVPIARQMMQWDKDFVEYGKVKKGDTREHIYRFKNISKEDIEISICSACECTTLDWSYKTIKPGEYGEVKTIFDSKDKNKEETIKITVILKNTDPIMKYPVVDEVSFHFDLIQ